jgi:hypothetical protein
MKNRSLCLLLIFCINLVPIYPVQAQELPTRSVYDSLAFMYVNNAILLGEEELEEAFHSPHLLAPVANNLHDEPDNATLAFALQAAKDLRNDLDANCSLLMAQYRQADKNCEADRIQSACNEKKAKINAEIGLLHKKRGDRRRPLTKVWHSLKRSGQSVWRRIGPVGRNFLRQVGPEALKIVASGGTLSTDVIINLFKHTAKTMIRGRIKKVVFQGVQRMISGQLEIAQAAGVDICDPEEEAKASEDEKTTNEITTSEEFKLPDTGVWELSCQHTHDAVLRDYQDINWKLTISWDAAYFEGTINGTSLEIDGNETTKWVWHEEVTGDITDDGFLWGEGTYGQTYSHAYGSNDPFVEERSYDQSWLGAISEDLDKICLFRVGAQQIDLKWIQERGRLEMLDNPGGLCEGLCIVK